MQEQFKQKIVSRLDQLSDDAGRQLLDYIEFLESRFAKARRPESTVEKIAQGIDDTLGTGEFASTAAKGASSFIDAAGKVMLNIANASKTLAEELQEQATTAGHDGQSDTEDSATAEGAAPAGDAPEAASQQATAAETEASEDASQEAKPSA
jgi:hypothetical protein